MDNRSKKRRAVELVKDLLIVALTCSALWLVFHSQRLVPQRGDAADTGGQTQGGQLDGESRAEAARPLRITASFSSGTELLRYGVQYDAQSCDTLFQQVANLLTESLSGAGVPEQVSRWEWEQALTNAPGLCFDFQGEIPLPVLVGWLAGEDTALTGTVRRVILAVQGGEVSLYFQNREDGNYYRCGSGIVNEQQVTQALSALSDNGAFYAVESEEYADLDPDTLISAVVPVPKVYLAANPVGGGQDSLAALMEELGLAANVNSFYYAGSAHVGRSGNDTIRLFDSGIAAYEAEEGSDHFRISARQGEPTLFESVEACRQLAAAVMGTRSGQARLYLSQVQEDDEGLTVSFEYCLNGSQVRLEGGSAAQFLVRNGQIVQFTLRFRSYSDSGETSVVLPVRQAAAAMEAEGLEGQELLLVYLDSGGDTVSASWAAADNRLDGEV